MMMMMIMIMRPAQEPGRGPAAGKTAVRRPPRRGATVPLDFEVPATGSPPGQAEGLRRAERAYVCTFCPRRRRRPPSPPSSGASSGVGLHLERLFASLLRASGGAQLRPWRHSAGLAAPCTVVCTAPLDASASVREPPSGAPPPQRWCVRAASTWAPYLRSPARARSRTATRTRPLWRARRAARSGAHGAAGSHRQRAGDLR